MEKELQERIYNLLNNPKLNLEQVDNKIKDLNLKIEQLSQSAKFNSSEFSDFSRELSKYNYTKQNIIEINQKVKLLQETEIFLDDEELKEFALNEINELKTRIELLITELEKEVLVVLKNDEKESIIEIRPGVGGVEASLFAEQLNHIYIRYCNSIGLQVESLSLEYDNEGGIKESIFSVNGSNSYAKLRFEAGVHRVQRVPVTESAGRIHTSSASVAVLPKFDIKTFEIKESELRFDVFRAGGPGGQSVNTTDSAVRITHIPTGIIVTSQASKSQHKNKEMALSVLVSKLQKIEEEKQTSEVNEIRTNLIQSGDRSVKIRTYNFQQGRITDHRINQNWFNLSEVISGDAMKDIIEEVNFQMRKKIS